MREFNLHSRNVARVIGKIGYRLLRVWYSYGFNPVELIAVIDMSAHRKRLKLLPDNSEAGNVAFCRLRKPTNGV